MVYYDDEHERAGACSESPRGAISDYSPRTLMSTSRQKIRRETMQGSIEDGARHFNGRQSTMRFRHSTTAFNKKSGCLSEGQDSSRYAELEHEVCSDGRC